MGRGRAKGKRLTPIAGGDDTGSGEEEKLTVKRRGRPHKPLKDDIEDGEVEKLEQDEGEETKSSVFSKSNKIVPATEIGRKRKKASPIKENEDSLKEENDKTNSTDTTKSVGYRQSTSRRKSKPRRAAEVGVRAYEDIVAH